MVSGMNAPLHVPTLPALGASSYRHSRPLALLFAHEETLSGYGAGGTEAAPPPPRRPHDPEIVTDWARVHERLVALGAERAAHERELCRWLLAAERLGVHARAGYASLGEYASRVLGLRGRQTEERLRVGRALAELPLLAEALGSGKLCFSTVRELSRVASPKTEQAWLDWSRGRTTRQVEEAVAARRPGDGPRDRADPSRIKHRLSFEVRAETMALFRDLEAAVRGDLGGRVDDDTLLFEIARRALGGPGDEGRASYQVALGRCEQCDRTSIDAGGRSHPVGEVVAEMAACDSQLLGLVGGDGSAGTEPAVEQEAPRAEAARTGPHVGAKNIASNAPTAARVDTHRRRASQTIPPAIRRQVMRRDGGRCRVDGCANHLFLDVHHLDPRSEGGSHDPERLVALCGSHHRAAHAGSLCIEGSATEGFRFRHADGSRYGEPPRAAGIELAQQALGALRSLGFRPGRARALIDAAMGAGGADDLESLLRRALAAS